jgi:hypothetical protein
MDDVSWQPFATRRLNRVQHEYEDRYVAFIDILGFSDLIRRSLAPNPGVLIEEIVRALEVPEEVRLDGIILGRIGDISAALHMLTGFSDCIAISTIASEQGLMNLLVHVRAIVFRMLRLGFLSRGWIARGPLYHRDGKIFGPAMLEAYRLESTVAVFPRVILAPEIVEAGLRAAPPIDRLFERMIRRNDDGFYMVHSLWAIRLAADSENGFVGEWLEIVDGIARFLEYEEKRLASEPHELEKVRWFREYFAWATDRHWVDQLRAPFPK